jgi:hypothetical protein
MPYFAGRGIETCQVLGSPRIVPVSIQQQFTCHSANGPLAPSHPDGRSLNRLRPFCIKKTRPDV